MTYAEAIKTLRKKMLITQTELAAQLGVAFVSVNRWENGTYGEDTSPYGKSY